jgi:hypothetical protein
VEITDQADMVLPRAVNTAEDHKVVMAAEVAARVVTAVHAAVHMVHKEATVVVQDHTALKADTVNHKVVMEATDHRE